MHRSQNLRCPFSVPSRRLCSGPPGQTVPKNWSPWTNGPQPIRSPWANGPKKFGSHGQMVPNQFGPRTSGSRTSGPTGQIRSPIIFYVITISVIILLNSRFKFQISGSIFKVGQSSSIHWDQTFADRMWGIKWVWDQLHKSHHHCKYLHCERKLFICY